jgi:hypothetical protein
LRERKAVRLFGVVFSHWGFLTITQRIVSVPEDKGIYTLSAFLGGDFDIHRSCGFAPLEPWFDKSWKPRDFQSVD